MVFPLVVGLGFDDVRQRLEVLRQEARGRRPDLGDRQRGEEAFERRLGDVIGVSRRFAFPLRQRHAVDYVQPSITKVGGFTEFMEVAGQAAAAGLNLMPHSPYFGPGWLASLQAMSAIENPGLVERLFVDHEASLYGDYINPKDGLFRVPDGPGLGLEPDADVIRDYKVNF